MSGVRRKRWECKVDKVQHHFFPLFFIGYN